MFIYSPRSVLLLGKISKKAEKFKRKMSPVRQIMSFADSEYIESLGVKPDELISMAGGWVNHESPEELRKAYEELVSNQEAFHKSGKYSATFGDIDFKKAICKFEKKLYNMKISEKEIAAGSGSTQLAMNLFATLLDPEDKILLLDPYYCNFPTQLITEIPDVEILSFSVIDEEKWEYIADKKIEEFVKYIFENKPKIILLTSPDNPTSKILSEKFMDATIKAAKEIDAFVVIDFAYKELIFNENYPSYFSWSPNENFIAIRSNSKWCRGLGRRLGWIEAPEFVIEAMESIQNSTSLCPDSLHQMAMTKFINNSIENNTLTKYIKETREHYKNVARKTSTLIKEQFNFPIIEPEGGLYFFIKVNTDGTKFVENALKKAGVLFVPGWGFGRSGINAIRLSFGPLVEDIDKIEEGLKRVAKHLDEITQVKG